MLLTVTGTRTTRELAELVKALLDRCQVYGYLSLADAIDAVEADKRIKVPEGQLVQVLEAMAAAQPAVGGPPPAPSEVIRQTTGDPGRLAELLELAWMHLAAECSEQAENADVARKAGIAFEGRFERLTLPGRCCLLVHDALSGRPLLPERAIRSVLAAGILAELILAERLRADGSGFRVRAYSDLEYSQAASVAQLVDWVPDGAAASDLQEQALSLPPPLGRLPDLSGTAAAVLTEVKSAHQQMTLDCWFEHLLPDAADLVRGELVKAEVIRPTQVKRMLRERTYYPPTDSIKVALLRGTIIGPLASDGALPKSAPTALLMELARASGLTRARTDDWFQVNALPKRAGLTTVSHRRACARLLDLVEEATDAAVFSPS